jgi:nickel transport protein
MPERALAHRLDAEATVRSFGRVQVEAWFETGDIPKSARVQVFRPDGRLLTEGKLDDQGIFTFTYIDAEPLRVVVDAGVGHRAEVKLKQADLERGAPPSGSAEVPHESGPDFERLALGVGILFTVAFGALILQRVRRSRLSKDLTDDRSVGRE